LQGGTDEKMGKSQRPQSCEKYKGKKTKVNGVGGNEQPLIETLIKQKEWTSSARSKVNSIMRSV